MGFFNVTMDTMLTLCRPNSILNIISKLFFSEQQLQGRLRVTDFFQNDTNKTHRASLNGVVAQKVV